MPAPSLFRFDRSLCLARNGDASAIGSLLDHYRAYLQLLARLQLGRQLAGRTDPSDIVQETLLRAARDLPAFRGQSERELAAWLRRVLVSSIADTARRHAHSRHILEAELTGAVDRSSAALEQTLISPRSSPSGHSARSEQAVLLANALAKLPEHYREVIVLHHLEELSLAEVASRMGRSLDSVKNLWIRAVAQLRHSLGDEP